LGALKYVPSGAVLTGHVELSCHKCVQPLIAGMDGPVRCGSAVQTILVTASTSVMQIYIGMLLIKFKLQLCGWHGQNMLKQSYHKGLDNH